MRKTVSACRDCGKQPCLHCKGTAYYCDWCGEEVNELYDYGDEVCYKCLAEYIRKNPDEIIDEYIEEVKK